MDTLIVGAGIAGLACARDLVGSGREVVLLDKGRGVGGRCATRRLDGQPVDHGLAYLHGNDDAFIATLREAAGDGLLDGWPRRVEGAGRPCMKRAFHAGEWRGAIRGGVNVFPKWLARALDVRRETFVESVRERGGSFDVVLRGGETVSVPEVVVTLPAPQAVRLLDPEDARDLRGAAALLGDVGTSCCLTLIADYGVDAPRPEVDLWLPEDTVAVHQISHDSAKREAGSRVVLVIQALPSWSGAHWDDPLESWTGALLREAGRVVGPWAEAPARIDVQRWRFARPDGASQLRVPMLLRSGRRGMMGFAGELFAPEGGVQGAWKSGRALARRMLGEDPR